MVHETIFQNDSRQLFSNLPSGKQLICVFVFVLLRWSGRGGGTPRRACSSSPRDILPTSDLMMIDFTQRSSFTGIRGRIRVSGLKDFASSCRCASIFLASGRRAGGANSRLREPTSSGWSDVLGNHTIGRVWEIPRGPPPAPAALLTVLWQQPSKGAGVGF